MASLTKKQVIAKLSVEEARAALDAALKREEARIEKKNKEFKALPSYRKRVVVAQDVLDQLRLKRLIPTLGVYLQLPETLSLDVRDRIEGEFEAYKDTNRSVKEVLSGVSCQVCGIGSLFVAAVDRANDCKANDMNGMNDDTSMRDYLHEWFSPKQLDLIEVAFEGRVVNGDDLRPSPAEKRAMAFARGIEDPAKRLVKIMKNVIQNEGDFVP